MAPKSKYTPEMCERAIELMNEGLSVMAVAGELGIGRRTVYDWIERIPEFSDAIEIGQARRCLFWERKMMGAGSGPEVTSCIFTLKNAAPEEWRDRVVVSGDKENPIEVRNNAAAELRGLLEAMATNMPKGGE